MPRRTYSPSREKARTMIKAIQDREPPPEEWTSTALVACCYALLEVAFQVGRVADQVPMWGPPSEQ